MAAAAFFPIVSNFSSSMAAYDQCEQPNQSNLNDRWTDFVKMIKSFLHLLTFLPPIEFSTRIPFRQDAKGYERTAAVKQCVCVAVKVPNFCKVNGGSSDVLALAHVKNVLIAPSFGATCWAKLCHRPAKSNTNMCNLNMSTQVTLYTRNPTTRANIEGADASSQALSSP